MLDIDGFRIGVGMIVCNAQGEILWAKRCKQDQWQFPQGGIEENETLEEAVYRELYEEVGLQAKDVEVLGHTPHWLYYWLPLRLRESKGYLGCKQTWFLVKLVRSSAVIQLNCSQKPEFDDWRWVKYWHPLKTAVYFKRRLYRAALNHLVPYLPKVQ